MSRPNKHWVYRSWDGQWVHKPAANPEALKHFKTQHEAWQSALLLARQEAAEALLLSVFGKIRRRRAFDKP